jgi:transcriptional regulator with XRE-family HTH domain
MAAMRQTRHAGGRPRRLPRTQMGQRIERLARERGLHIDQVAAKAGIKGPTLNRILTGRIESPKTSTVLALAKVLRVKVDQLLN